VPHYKKLGNYNHSEKKSSKQFLIALTEGNGNIDKDYTPNIAYCKNPVVNFPQKHTDHEMTLQT